MKCTLSCTDSGGCTTSLVSVAPNSVSILLAVAIEGSLPLTGDAATSYDQENRRYFIQVITLLLITKQCTGKMSLPSLNNHALG